MGYKPHIKSRSPHNVLTHNPPISASRTIQVSKVFNSLIPYFTLHQLLSGPDAIFFLQTRIAIPRYFSQSYGAYFKYIYMYMYISCTYTYCKCLRDVHDILRHLKIRAIWLAEISRDGNPRLQKRKSPDRQNCIAPTTVGDLRLAQGSCNKDLAPILQLLLN